MSNKVEPGDWVCFLQLSMPIYGKVEYILPEKIAQVITSAGTCSIADVLEVRKKS